LALFRASCSANSFFFWSKRVCGIPEALACASSMRVHNSEENAPAPSPRKPARSSCAFFGSGDTLSDGRNKLMAVEETISSSNPRMEVTFCSIHWVRMGLLTFSRSTVDRKFFGNRVFRSSFCLARESETDAVPLTETILCCLFGCLEYSVSKHKNLWVES
jgi:hypothetical protein